MIEDDESIPQGDSAAWLREAVEEAHFGNEYMLGELVLVQPDLVCQALLEWNDAAFRSELLLQLSFTEPALNSDRVHGAVRNLAAASEGEAKCQCVSFICMAERAADFHYVMTYLERESDPLLQGWIIGKLNHFDEAFPAEIERYLCGVLDAHPHSRIIWSGLQTLNRLDPPLAREYFQKFEDAIRNESSEDWHRMRSILGLEEG